MSEKSWVLRGVDAEARQAALAEAERRGLSLPDYLTEVLLGEVLAGQIEAPAEPAPEAEPAFAAPQRSSRENFAFRHRVEALERRLTASLGGLDGALQALDSTVLSLTGQLDETGALAEDGAVALIELSANVAALRKRLTDAEENAESLIENNDQAHEGLAARCAALEAHLTSVEAIAYAADATGARLAQAQEALQRALAQDFNAFAHESDRRFEAASEDMRALAEDAAAHADAAAQRAIEALRLTREAMEQNLVDQAEETRAVVHGAFVDAADRIDALADRVLENQRVAQRMGEQMNARLNNIEDAAHIAIEETADALRSADATLSAEIARAVQDSRAAVADLAARQDDAAQRLKLVDFALNNAIADVAAFREEAQASLGDVETVFEARYETLDADVRARHDALDSGIRARLEAVMARLDHVAETATYDFQQAAANIDRVEACTFAALEKLARDIAEGDAAASEHLITRLSAIDRAVGAQERAALDLHARIGRLESSADSTRAEETLAGLAEDVNARFARIESALDAPGTSEAIATLAEDVNTRLGQLERTAADTRTEHALAALTEEVQLVANQVRENDAMAQLTELRLRVEAQNSLLSDAADRTHGVARMLSRVTAQNADVAAQAEERLHKLELGLTDLRLDIASVGANAAAEEAIVDIAERMAGLERRQAAALEALHADIAAFIEDNDRRLGALEQGGVATLTGDEVLIAHAIEARLTELEQRDPGADFETLRKRIEDRLLGVERSSVRALEQMADTIALIEKRYSEGDEALAQTA